MALIPDLEEDRDGEFETRWLGGVAVPQIDPGQAPGVAPYPFPPETPDPGREFARGSRLRMAAAGDLDVSGLTPLDTSGLTPLDDTVTRDSTSLDTTGLTPLDTSGLTPADEQSWSDYIVPKPQQWSDLAVEPPKRFAEGAKNFFGS